MAVDAATLLTRVRETLRDAHEPYLLDDSTIFQALSEAQHRLARYAFCFVMTRGLSYPVSAGELWVDVDAAIIRPRSISVRASGRVVEPVVAAEISERMAVSDYGEVIRDDWRSQTDTEPRYVITDLENYAWRLVPIPTADCVLDVTAWYYPDPIAEGGETPLSDFDAHGLVDGAVAILLLKADIELYDPSKAQYHELRWMEFLHRMYTDSKRHTRPSREVRQRKGYW